MQKEGDGMARTAAIGVQDFEVIISNNYFYVDKTNFIREWWENGDSVTPLLPVQGVLARHLT